MDGPCRIAAHVGILAVISLLFGVRVGITWEGGAFYEYLTNWMWTCMVLFMAAAVITATVPRYRHYVLCLWEPITVSWACMVWITILLVLALGDESALQEARDHNLETGAIMAAEKLTHTVPLLLLLAFCVAIGVERFREAKRIVESQFGSWFAPVVWVVTLASIFGIYMAAFVPENVYNTPIDWEIIIPVSSVITLLVLVVFYYL